MPAFQTLIEHPSRTVVETVSALQPALETLVSVLALPIQFVSFWVAALLPLTYLPLLATGSVGEYPTAFLAVLCVNAIAFVLGHGYRRPDAT